ncbi:prostaglandin E synthase 3-like [Pteronotus mesoamericanus]|uniref:prostaglandin E synthase 3-like n=1 Tax=Pteronotus mesoamericanus TaxID=1884717 RepID=UPI0023EA822A|nr:prostaglandin E synthase 3-like [Pteronotus parnellii mesoamericanus]
MQPASTKWCDQSGYVFIRFVLKNSKDSKVNFEKSKLTFSCFRGSDHFKHLNEIDIFNYLDPNDSKHKTMDRYILCFYEKGESGQSWQRLRTERTQLNWLSILNNMGGDEDIDLPE